MKTHLYRAAGDSHKTLCGLDDRKHSFDARMFCMSMKSITCKRCNGQARRA